MYDVSHTVRHDDADEFDVLLAAGAALAHGSNPQEGLDAFCDVLGSCLDAAVRVAPEAESDEVAVSLAYCGEALGVLCIRRERPLDARERELANACGRCASVAAYAERVRSENDRLQASATRDAVTGVANRRVFDAELAASWKRAARDGSWLSLLMLDIDWFKRFNDNYGHVAGDECLARVAQAARACLKRDTDLFARYGGEEFVALLWATGAADAREVAERVRSAVADVAISHADSPFGHVTVSVGVAACEPKGDDMDVLKRAADRALYAAKTSGRDRVVVDRLEVTSGASTTYRASNNLRAIGTSFLGRSDDAAAVAAIMGEGRLVTIVGPGGVGKTRLALALGQRNVYAYLDGAWFVDFASTRCADEIETAVAVLLGIGQSGHESVRNAVLAQIAPKNMLLMFDNCEHVRERVAAFSADILRVAPRVSIVATSREALHVEGETTYALGPLDAATATGLFVERAQAAFPPFSVLDGERHLLECICERLDNLPLAIELAAPLVKTMRLEELYRGLEDRFRLLIANRRDANARQQTLFATLDWSVNLLALPERRLLENLSVFPAAATADAVRDVCALGGVEPWDILPALETLIEKNLVSVIDRTANERFALLESTREFARRGRAERGEDGALNRRFIYYYAALARRIGEMAGDRLEAIIAVATAEWPNLEAALVKALDERIDPESGVAMAQALFKFWAEGGRLVHGSRWTERALSAVAPGPARVSLLFNAARFAQFRGDFAGMEEFGEELVRLHGDGTADPLGYANALMAVGGAKFNLRDADGARALFARALEAHRVAGDARGIAAALANLGAVISEYDCDAARARPLFIESLELLRTLGPSIQMASALANLALISAKLDDFMSAIEYDRQSLEIFERLGNQTLAAWPLLEMSEYRLALHDEAGCAQSLRRAGTYLAKAPNLSYVAQFGDVAFYLACETARYELAATIYGFVERYRSENNVPRLPGDTSKYEPHLALLQSRLDPASFMRLSARGAGLDFAAICASIEEIAAA